MPGHQRDQEHRGDTGVQGVEADQRGATDLRTTAEHRLQPAADAGKVADHAGADGDRPVRQLVPGQQVAGEVGDEHEQKQQQSDDPVETPRSVEAAGEEDPQHVQQHDDAPVVDCPYQPAEQDLLLHDGDRVVGPRRRGLVDEHHQDAGRHQQQDQDHRRPAETEGVGVADRLLGNADRPQVEDEGVENDPLAVAVGLRQERPPEYRAPDSD